MGIGVIIAGVMLVEVETGDSGSCGEKFGSKSPPSGFDVGSTP